MFWMNDQQFDERVAKEGIVNYCITECFICLSRDQTVPRHDRFCQIFTAAVVPHYGSVNRANVGIVIFSCAFNADH